MYVTFQNKSLGNGSSSSEEGEQLHPVDLFLINDLWVPNVFIYNLKTFKVSICSLNVLYQPGTSQQSFPLAQNVAGRACLVKVDDFQPLGKWHGEGQPDAPKLYCEWLVSRS